MEKWEQTANSGIQIDRVTYRHFQAMPLEAQRVAIRRLVLRGLPADEISARTGWTTERVHRFMSEDEGLTLPPTIRGTALLAGRAARSPTH